MRGQHVAERSMSGLACTFAGFCGGHARAVVHMPRNRWGTGQFCTLITLLLCLLSSSYQVSYALLHEAAAVWLLSLHIMLDDRYPVTILALVRPHSEKPYVVPMAAGSCITIRSRPRVCNRRNAQWRPNSFNGICTASARCNRSEISFRGHQTHAHRLSMHQQTSTTKS